jgi:hypothetical protein
MVFGEALCQVALAEPERALVVAGEALELDDVAIARNVSWAYSVRLLRSRDGILAEERALAERLIQSADDFTATSIIRGVAAQATSDRSWTHTTLLSARIDRSPLVADEVFATFHAGELQVGSLGAATLAAFLEKLATCPRIENHWIQEFLGKASRVAPGRVVELLIGRIEQDAGDTTGEFQAMPYLWDEHPRLAIRESGDLGNQLKRIREWLLTAPANVATGFWGPKLYAAVAGGYDQAVLDDLDTWTESGDAKKLAVVGRILQEAPRGFVFDQRAWVVRLLDRTAVVSDECVRKLQGSLWGSAMSGGRQGTVGMPFPEDEERRDRAAEALTHVSRSSPAWALFDGLMRDAQRDIKWKQREDEELFEE